MKRTRRVETPEQHKARLRESRWLSNPKNYSIGPLPQEVYTKPVSASEVKLLIEQAWKDGSCGPLIILK